VLSAGKLRQVGDPMSVYTRPTDRFVAGFVGVPAMNFFDGRVSIDAAGVHFVCEGNIVPLPRAWESQLRPVMNEPLALAVRPTSMRMVNTTSPGLSVRVRHVELLGDQMDVHATGPGGVVNEGTTLRVACDPAGSHVFRTGAFGSRVCGGVGGSEPVKISSPGLAMV
jgi:ABC-type sugar transport system ATPase subunit